MPEVGDLTSLLPRPGGGAGPAGAGAGAAGTAARDVAAALGLRAGDVVEVSVVEALGQGQGIVELEGRLLRALYPEGLAAGARVALRVASTGPPLLLRLPEPGEAALARLLSPPASGFGQAVRGLLAAAADPAGGPELRRLLEGAEVLRLPTSPSELAPALAKLLQRSGLFHEALLGRGEDPGDLKSLALRLLAAPASPPLHRLAEILLGHVEAHQARSVAEGTVTFPFVLPWGGDGVVGEWVVEERSGRGPLGEALSGAVRIRLEMPRLGPVEVGVRWGPSGTAVRLRLAPEGLAEVSAQMGELREALTGAAGVRLVELRADALPRASASAGPGLLEVVA